MFKYSGSRTIAVKEIPQAKLYQEGKLELQVLSALSLNHDNIVAFYGHDTLNGTLRLFMELCNMDLKSYMGKEKDTLLHVNVFNILFQAAKGIEYMHSKRIVHRDLKLENILIMTEGNDKVVAKISDFGISFQFEGSIESAKESLTILGTQSYWAPEMLQIMLKSQNAVDKIHGFPYAIDIFAFGVVTYRAFNDEFPFIMDERCKADFNARTKINHDFKDMATSFQECL